MEKVCDKGHKYLKTSDCPVCPVCVKLEKPQEGFLSLLSAPARRALESIDVSTVEELSKRTEKEILQLHGMGKASLPILREALAKENRTFKR
jgi:DNA-directed RNA polymerase alpha subunit